MGINDTKGAQEMRGFLKKSLALILCASLLPLSAFAETEEQSEEVESVSAEAPAEVPASEELPEAPAEEPQGIEEAPDVEELPAPAEEPEEPEEPAEEPEEEPEQLPEEAEEEEETDRLPLTGASITVDRVNYVIDDDGNAAIVGYTENFAPDKGEFYVPENVPEFGNQVTAIREYAFENCGEIKKLFIPRSIQTIGAAAFSGCNNLREIRFDNDGWVDIGENAFHANSLTETGVRIEWDDRRVPAYMALYDWVSDNRNVSFKVNDELRWSYHSDTGELKMFGSGEIPDEGGRSWKELGSYLAAEGKCVENLRIEDGIQFVGDSCFADMPIRNVSLSASVEEVRAHAFEGVFGLASVSMPGVKHVGNNAFARCSTGEGASAAVSMPAVEIIEDGAFADWAELKTVTMTAVQKIRDSAFTHSGVTAVNMPNAEYIGNNAFSECRSLTSAKMDSAKDIGAQAFLNCTALTEVSYASAEFIQDMAFCGCTSLRGKLFIPKTLWGFSVNAFWDCHFTELEVEEGNYSGYFANADKSLLYQWLSNGEIMVVYALPDRVNGMYVVPSEAVAISDYAFYRCYGLTGLVFSTNHVYIGSYAFGACDDLREIVLPQLSYLPLEIADNAFYTERPCSTVIRVPDKDLLPPTVKNYKWAADNRSVTYESFTEFAVEQEYYALEVGESVIIEGTSLFKDIAPERISGVGWFCRNKEKIKTHDEDSSIPEGAVKFTSNEPGTDYLFCVPVLYAGGFVPEYRPIVCRIDVTESYDEVWSVSLVENKATVELYKTDYTKIEVLLDLEQNHSLLAAAPIPVWDDAAEYENQLPEEKGVAITDAWFTDPKAAELFDLRVFSDRTLEIVPKYDTLKMTSVKCPASTVTVKINDGFTVETHEKLTLTVKYTKPAVKATKLAFNSFYNNERLNMFFTNGTVTAVEKDPAKASAAWADVDCENMTVGMNENVYAKTSGSGNLYLLATVEGFAVKQEIAVPVSYKYTAPVFQLVSSTVTLPEKLGYDLPFTVEIVPKAANMYLDDICDVQVRCSAEGKYELGEVYPSYNQKFKSGSIMAEIMLKDGVPSAKDKIYIDLYFNDCDKPVTLTLSVKVQSVITLKADPATVTVEKDKGAYVMAAAAGVTLPLSGLGEHPFENYIEVTVADGKYLYPDPYCFEFVCMNPEIDYRSDSMGCWVSPGKEAVPGKTYTVTVDFTQAETGIKPLSFKVTVPKEGAAVSASMKKTAGAIDLSRMWTEENYETKNYDNLTVMATYKNAAPVDWSRARIEERDKSGKNVLREDVIDDLFWIDSREGFRKGNTASYDIYVKYDRAADIDQTNSFWLAIDDERLAKKAEFKLPITRSNVTFNPDKSSVIMSLGKQDYVEITAKASLKNYQAAYENVSVSVRGYEEEDWDAPLIKTFKDVYYDWNTGYSYVRFGMYPKDELIKASGVYTYNVDIKDGKNPVKTVKVTVKNTDVKTTLKATGSIDILRSNTSITLKATYGNYNTYPDDYLIYVSRDNGKSYTWYAPQWDLEDCPFNINWEDAQTWTLRFRDSIDPAKDKFKVKIVPCKWIPTGENEGYWDYFNESNAVSLSVKMGSGKVTADRTAVTLRGMDRFQMEKIKITPTDPALRVAYVCMTPNQTVKINGTKYYVDYWDAQEHGDSLGVLNLNDFGDGNISLGFAYMNGMDNLPAKGQTISVKLNVFFNGNATAKPNTTATIKVTLLP